MKKLNKLVVTLATLGLCTLPTFATPSNVGQVPQIQPTGSTVYKSLQASPSLGASPFRRSIAYYWALDNNGGGAGAWFALGKYSPSGGTPEFAAFAGTNTTGATTNLSTASDSDGVWAGYITAAVSGRVAGVTSSSADECKCQHQPIAWFRFKTGSITSACYYIGMGGGVNAITTNSYSAHGTFLRYDSALDGTTWHLVTEDSSGSANITDTGVTCSANTPYDVCFDLTDTTKSSVYVNGFGPTTSGTNHMPTTTSYSGPTLQVQTNSGASVTLLVGAFLMTFK